MKSSFKVQNIDKGSMNHLNIINLKNTRTTFTEIAQTIALAQQIILAMCT
jgi:hypothetical protein